MLRPLLFGILLGSVAAPSLVADDAAPKNRRVAKGLVVMYDFAESNGDIVKDKSGVGEPLDLRIADTKAVKRKNGSLDIQRETVLRSNKPATKLTNSVRRSGAITIEAWVVPSKTNQTGPARIVSLSESANARNFTLGQDGDHYDVRFRTKKTNSNGIPSTASPNKSLTTRLTHVVYVRERSGKTRLYLDGKQRKEQSVSGSLDNWQSNLSLAIANEVNKGRPWLGELHLVAIYARNLSPREIKQNFDAGSDGQFDATAHVAEQRASRNRRTFETKVAALLANRCLECHDTITKEGGLDLSTKATAFAGGDSGKAIIPGKLSGSLLWESVASDEMPKEQTPLTSGQKQLLKEWIASGATWSLDVIDPAIYAHDEKATDLWIQRLTVDEYIETVRAAVGVDISKEARKLLPRDLRADGFSNTAYNLNVDLKHVEAYAQLAAIAVERMDVLKFTKRFSRSRSLSTDATMRELVAEMGKWLLRGPLDKDEEITYSGIATTVASAGGSFEEAASYLIEAMLQSPRFIYRIENQRGDGGANRVGAFELASRMSYIIWGGPPDEALMRSAEKGELDHAGVEQHASRMLKDPRAIARSIQFVSEWLDLGRMENMRPGEKRFPNWDAALAGDMRLETIEFFKDVAWRSKRPLGDLLNAQFTYATPRLAEFYGLSPASDSLSRYDLSKVPARGGLLTHGSVLTVGGDDASMVTRGLFVLHDVLRGTVKDPPPGLDITPVPSKPGLSQRGIAEQRIANYSCGGCHIKFEPLAFGLEKFDGIGAYHDKDEYGNELRDDGEILFPGTGEPVKYGSSAELMDLLAGNDRVRQTITWKLTQFSLGRPLVAADAPIVAKIHQASQAGGSTYPSLITAIVMSDLVQMTRTERTE